MLNRVGRVLGTKKRPIPQCFCEQNICPEFNISAHCGGSNNGRCMLIGDMWWSRVEFKVMFR